MCLNHIVVAACGFIHKVMQQSLPIKYTCQTNLKQESLTERASPRMFWQELNHQHRGRPCQLQQSAQRLNHLQCSRLWQQAQDTPPEQGYQHRSMEAQREVHHDQGHNGNQDPCQHQGQHQQVPQEQPWVQFSLFANHPDFDCIFRLDIGSSR